MGFNSGFKGLKEYLGQNIVLYSDSKIDLRQHSPGEQVRYIHRKTWAHGGKVVTLTHRPSLPPGISWYSFLEAESTPGHM